MSRLELAADRLKTALQALEQRTAAVDEASSGEAILQGRVAQLEAERERLLAQVADLEARMEGLSGASEEVEERLDGAIGEIRAALARN